MSDNPPIYTDIFTTNESFNVIKPNAPYFHQDYKENREEKLKRLQEICNKLKISNFFANKLRQLEDFEIVLIADDSTSMNTICKPGVDNMNKQNKNDNNIWVVNKTRWSELKETTNKIVEIA